MNTTEPPCTHQPRCPAAGRPGDLAAKIIAAHPDQGWHLLCNGIITFDTGEVIRLPDRDTSGRRHAHAA